jgi:uncharacterized membrane protein
MKMNKTLIITTILCLLPIILGIAVYDRLPDQVAIHFDSQGNPDNYLSKALAVFGLPIVMALINLYINFRMNNDAKVENASSFLRSLSRWIIPLIAIVMIPVSLFLAMDAEIRIPLIATAIAGVIIVIYGNFLPKCKYNYTIGIRLPWTLNSEYNWNKTNRFAGYIFVIGGLIFIVNAFLSLWYVSIAIITLLIILPFIYSYLLFRKERGNKDESLPV